MNKYAYQAWRRDRIEREKKAKRKGRGYSCYKDPKELKRYLRYGRSIRLPQPDDTTKSKVRGWKRGDPIHHYGE